MADEAGAAGKLKPETARLLAKPVFRKTPSARRRRADFSLLQGELKKSGFDSGPRGRPNSERLALLGVQAIRSITVPIRGGYPR